MAEFWLDQTKLGYHLDRVEEWKRTGRCAPVTIDLALTRACNFKCLYCYSELQTNKSFPIKKEHMTDFIDDCAELGVRAISLVSDGESTLSPAYVHTIQYGKSRGIDMASGTNAYLLREPVLREVMPHLSYLRVNITAGESKRYQEIMGVREGWFEQVCENIKTMVRLKRENGWECTIGMQMVLMPQYADQILPLSALAVQLEPDYLVIKHCSDNERGELGVDYKGYAAIEDLLHQAEGMSNEQTKIVVKWNKIKAEGKREYERCYGPPFQLQISGSGLVAPCGMLFAEEYKRFHISNITKERFKNIVKSDRYWEVMNFLSSPKFNAKTMCGSLCLQHLPNTALDRMMKGELTLERPSGPEPAHVNFL